MKTENDLFEALVRYSFETTGASKAQIDLVLPQFRRQLMENLKTIPPRR
jgi:hypothetical protein